MYNGQEANPHSKNMIKLTYSVNVSSIGGRLGATFLRRWPGQRLKKVAPHPRPPKAFLRHFFNIVYSCDISN